MIHQLNGVSEVCSGFTKLLVGYCKHFLEKGYRISVTRNAAGLGYIYARSWK